MASHLGEAAAFPHAAATSDDTTVPLPAAPDDDDDEGCLVCAAAPREVRLRPCGHSTTCTQCALRLATSASPLRCPTCRAVATHVGWDPRGRPLAPRRVATFEDSPAAAEHSIGEFVRIAGVEPYVFHRPDAIPQELCDSLGAALEVDALRGGPEESLLGVPRDPCWTDLIDPDLCLLDGEPARWLPAAADVDAAGAATWASWVNHLHPRRHAALLHLLARLLSLALPSLEAAAALRLAPSRLRLVLGAYAHTPPPHGGAYTPSAWHTDGTRAERVLATACCYLEVAPRLAGGGVQFAPQRTPPHAEAALTVRPRTGSLLAFGNARLAHRVLALSGGGRRRLVAFHLIDPAAALPPPPPRLLAAHRREECLGALCAAVAPRVLPPRALEAIWRHAATGAAPAELAARRDASRRRRLARPEGRRTATGTFPVDWREMTLGSGTGTDTSFESGPESDMDVDAGADEEA